MEINTFLHKDHRRWAHIQVACFLLLAASPVEFLVRVYVKES